MEHRMRQKKQQRPLRERLLEAGVEELKRWLQAKYDQFSAGKGLAD